MTVTEYGIKWIDDGMNERVSWVTQDPDYYVHRDIINDPVVGANAVKVTRQVTYTAWEEVQP